MTEPLELNIDLTQTDTSFPTLMEGQVPVRCTKAEIVESKQTPGYFGIACAFQTTAEAQTIKGEVQAAGFPLRTWDAVVQSDNPNALDYKQGIAKLTDALLGITDPDERPEFNSELIATFPGKECLANIKVGEFNGSASNEIKSLVRIK